MEQDWKIQKDAFDSWTWRNGDLIYDHLCREQSSLSRRALDVLQKCGKSIGRGDSRKFVRGLATERNARTTTFLKFDFQFEEDELVVEKTMVEAAFSKHVKKEVNMKNN